MRKFVVMLLLAALPVFLVAGAAMAAPFNVRPVAPPLVNLGALQTNLDALDPGINVYNDQNGAAIWSTSPSGNSTFTIMLELAGWMNTNKFGLYNDGNAGNLFEVFAGSADVGDYATVTFNYLGVLGDVLVNYTDVDNLPGSSYTIHNGVHSSSFGFYLDARDQGVTNSLLYFSEDDENPNNTAQNLVYESPTGTGWWICFEDQARWISSDSDFTDFVIFAESVRPVPEPATLLLLGTGLVGLAGIGRKKFFKK